MKPIIRLMPLCLIFGLALGHDMWLESMSFIIEKVGQRIVVRNGNGTIYQKSENAVAADRIFMLVGRGPDGASVSLEAPEVDDVWLNVGFTPRKAGNYWVGLATQPRLIRLSGADFADYLRLDGIPKILKEREARGISDRDEIEKYSKYVKAYLQVGGKNSDNFKVPLGLTIEIIPLQNPYSIPVGGALPVQVLFQDKPLGGLTLHAGHDGQVEPTTEIDTDRNGKAKIVISAAGKWYIRGIHLSRVDQEDHSYESYWATLTFQVAG